MEDDDKGGLLVLLFSIFSLVWFFFWYGCLVLFFFDIVVDLFLFSSMVLFFYFLWIATPVTISGCSVNTNHTFLKKTMTNKDHRIHKNTAYISLICCIFMSSITEDTVLSIGH